MTQQKNIYSFEQAKRPASSRRASVSSRSGQVRPSVRAEKRMRTASAVRPDRSVRSVKAAGSMEAIREERPGRFVVREETSFATDDSTDSEKPKRKTVWTVLCDMRETTLGIAEKVSGVRRGALKSKAGKDFDRQFGGSDASMESEGPRAAIYKAEMGSSHKHAARLQVTREQQSHGRSTAGAGFMERVYALKSSKPAVAGLAVVACLLFGCVFLYQPTQQYYQSIRAHARAEAEYAIIQERNEELQNQVNYLSTDEGMAQAAHEQFGMVKKGENSVSVNGVHDSKNDYEINPAIYANTTPMPETWYSPILDPIFGVS